MNKKFVFDKKTGTMQPSTMSGGALVEKTVKTPPQLENIRVDDEKLKKLEEYAKELGLEGILLFRQQTDYTIFQIVDERSRQPMAYISGYALNIKFNMMELNNIAKVEQCLDGIKKLFRSFIVEQAIENK